MQLWRIHLASARNASVHPYSFFLTFYNQTYTDMFWPPYNICLFVLAVQSTNKYEIWIKRWCSYIHSTCSCNIGHRMRFCIWFSHLICYRLKWYRVTTSGFINWKVIVKSYRVTTSTIHSNWLTGASQLKIRWKIASCYRTFRHVILTNWDVDR